MSGAQPTTGVAAVGAQGTFPGRNTQDFFEVCRAYGHLPWMCTILKKYSNVPNNTYCEFFTSTTHYTDQCRALDALAKRLDKSTFRVNESNKGGKRRKWARRKNRRKRDCEVLQLRSGSARC